MTCSPSRLERTGLLSLSTALSRTLGRHSPPLLACACSHCSCWSACSLIPLEPSVRCNEIRGSGALNENVQATRSSKAGLFHERGFWLKIVLFTLVV
jgi:hypothetical protein